MSTLKRRGRLSVAFMNVTRQACTAWPSLWHVWLATDGPWVRIVLKILQTFLSKLFLTNQKALAKQVRLVAFMLVGSCFLFKRYYWPMPQPSVTIIFRIDRSVAHVRSLYLIIHISSLVICLYFISCVRSKYSQSCCHSHLFTHASIST